MDNTPINAVTAEGEPLTLAGEVMDYYIKNLPGDSVGKEKIPDSDTE